jgi:hypothetical protein
MIDTNSAPPKGAIANLQTIGKRIADAELTAAIRAVAYQCTRDSQALEAATKTNGELTSRLAVVTRQRDTALRDARDLPDRIERLSVEYRAAMAQTRTAIAERDEARGAWERLRVENEALKAKPAPAKPKRLKQPETFANVPDVEPGSEEVAMMAERAKVVAEVDRLVAIGKTKRTGAQQAQLVVAQTQLATFAPKVKAFKAARHAERMARGAAAQVAVPSRNAPGPPDRNKR